MSYVVAFIDQQTCKIFESKLDCPAGSLVFSGPEELVKSIPTGVMDEVRKRLLGQIVPKSSSPAEAANRLWHVFGMGVRARQSRDYSKSPVKLDKFGNKKMSVKKIDMVKLSWIQGKDPLVDVFYKKLPAQAKQIVDILTRDGRKVWTLDEAKQLMVDNEGLFTTTQGVLPVFKFYLSALFKRKILAPMSFQELALHPEFAAISTKK